LERGGRYRADVIRTLPPCGQANSISEIERFIRQMKPANYYSGGP